MGNYCIICIDEPKVYVPIKVDQVYKSPDNTFKTSFGTIKERVPPTPYTSPQPDKIIKIYYKSIIINIIQKC